MLGSLWRFAVALALVPVVLIASPTVAQAATATHTDYVGASFEFGGWGPDTLGVPLESAVCSGSFAMSRDSLGQVLFKTGGGGCVGAIDHSPWSCQVFEEGCTNYRITVQGVGACDGIVLTPGSGDHPRDGMTTVASTWGTSNGSTQAGNCDPTHVCLNAGTSQWGNDAGVGECSEIDLDPPAEGTLPDGSACAPGEPTRARHWKAPDGASGFDNGMYRVKGTIRDDAVAWRMYFVQSQDDGVNVGIGWVGSLSFSPAGVGPDRVATEALYRQWLSGSSQYPIVGVGLYIGPYGGGALSLPQNGGTAGISDPSQCMFYFGDKVAQTPNDTLDEPFGPLLDETEETGGPEPTPPPLNDPDPEADPVDENTSENTWWGMIVALLRAVVAGIVNLGKAIGGLAGDIVDGIVGGLSGLFVPDQAVIDSEVAGLRDSWDATSLAKWKDAVTGNTYSMPGAGCNGVPVDVDLPGGIGVHERLGEACSGTMANTAQIIKAVMSAGLIIFGGIACLRALGSGFGWNPGIGRGAES